MKYIYISIYNNWKNKNIIFSRYYEDGIGISLDETTMEQDVNDIFKIFSTEITVKEIYNEKAYFNKNLNKSHFARCTPYLQHPVFNSHQSETRIVRYMKSLENKDVSLVHSMIPLVKII